MKEPEFILKWGTKVKTSPTLGSVAGVFVQETHIALRAPNLEGTICGVVGGCGGDIYFVGHGEPKDDKFQPEQVAVYGWTEFDLLPDPPPTLWEHLDAD